MANAPDYLGEELKFAVNITAQGFSMADDDFDIIVSVGKIKQTYNKLDLVVDDQGNYYLLVDTTAFKKGDMYATIYAYVPDPDFDDGFRTEIDKVKLTTLIAP